jgi:hypothetical protein
MDPQHCTVGFRVVFSSLEGFRREFREFSVPRNSRNSVRITICSVYSVFRGIIFLSEILNLSYRMARARRSVKYMLCLGLLGMRRKRRLSKTFRFRLGYGSLTFLYMCKERGADGGERNKSRTLTSCWQHRQLRASFLWTLTGNVRDYPQFEQSENPSVLSRAWHDMRGKKKGKCYILIS